MIKAMAAEQSALVALMGRLGVDEVTVVDAMAQSEVLVRAVADVASHDPELAGRLAVAAQAAGSAELAEAIEALARGGRCAPTPRSEA